jgi:hypothetical protein
MRERTQEQPRSRPWLIPLLIGLAVSGLLCTLVVGALLLRGAKDGGFDAARWRQSSECVPENPRLGMYPALRDRLLAERPARAEVEALLGPGGAGDGSEALVYVLGINMIDCDTMRVEFGPDGRISEIRQIQG